MVVLAVAFASAVQAGIIIGMAHQSNSISSMYNVLNSVSYASAESASLSLGGTNAGGFSIGFPNSFINYSGSTWTIAYGGGRYLHSRG